MVQNVAKWRCGTRWGWGFLPFARAAAPFCQILVKSHPSLVIDFLARERDVTRVVVPSLLICFEKHDRFVLVLAVSL